MKDVLKIRTPGLQSPMRDEIDWLLGQTTIERVGETLRAAGNVVPSDVACGFLRAYRGEPRAGRPSSASGRGSDPCCANAAGRDGSGRSATTLGRRGTAAGGSAAARRRSGCNP